MPKSPYMGVTNTVDYKCHNRGVITDLRQWRQQLHSLAKIRDFARHLRYYFCPTTGLFLKKIQNT